MMRLSEMGFSQRKVATSVNCGKTTVGDIMRRCRDAGLTYATASGMSGTEIHSLLYPAKPTGQKEHVVSDWETVDKWLRSGKRRNLQYAWEEYRRGKPEGLGYSQFCRRYRAWKEAAGKTVAMVQNYEPGEKMFIDWVGDTLDCVVDADTGKMQTAHF